MKGRGRLLFMRRDEKPDNLIFGGLGVVVSS